MNKKIKVVDLFSGCGGLSFGLCEAGFEVVLGVDNWQDSLDTFAKNHISAKTYNADLSKETPAAICKKFGIKREEIDVVVGGPPCQGFSISGKRNPDDPRNKLYRSFVDFVSYLRPKAFVMENVPNLVSMQGGKIKDQIISDFSEHGYRVEWKILDASDFGVPQKRKRVFFVGLLGETAFEFPTGKITKPITAAEAISDLPEETVPNGYEYPTNAKTDYQEEMRKGSRSLHNHEIIVHTEKTKKIIAMVPDGGNYKNLPKHLWNTRKVNIAWTRLNSGKPSYTIDTGHNHIFHYKYNRVPTARESARIQSFPDTFVFWGKNKASHLKQVGNAVPPKLAAAIGKKLLKYI